MGLDSGGGCCCECWGGCGCGSWGVAGAAAGEPLNGVLQVSVSAVQSRRGCHILVDFEASLTAPE